MVGSRPVAFGDLREPTGEEELLGSILGHQQRLLVCVSSFDVASEVGAGSPREPLTAEPQLAGYGYLAAARADFLRRLGRNAEARHAYEEALLMTENRAEQLFLAGRLAEITERNRA